MLQCAVRLRDPCVASWDTRIQPSSLQISWATIDPRSLTYRYSEPIIDCALAADWGHMCARLEACIQAPIHGVARLHPIAFHVNV